jgi:hypothetical protein
MGLFATGPKSGYLRSNDPDAASRWEATEERLKFLISGKPDLVAEFYKFYQERVETLRTRLWTMLAWLSGVQGAIFVFIVKDLKTQFGATSGSVFTLDQPVLALILAIFGMALSTWMLHLIDDGSGHIETNWRRADLVMGKAELHVVEQDRRRRRGNHPVCRVMAEFAGWTRIADGALALLAVLVMIDAWSSFDIPLVGGPTRIPVIESAPIS